MQLGKNNDLKTLLTLATCSLLGTQAQAENNNEWQFDTALMYYTEQDRVSALEGIISAKKEYDVEAFLDLKLTFDTLTGASANGAVAQPNVQTFTRPSGKGSFTINANETPLDDTFRDTRVQLNAQWTQPLNRDYLISAGAHLSKEYDYLSLGINGNIARDFNKKNTTLSLGLAYSSDTIEPEGGIPKAFSAMLPASSEPDSSNRIGADDDKTTVDILLGLTQVINRRMIMQFNYSYSQIDGYLTDPFKVVSLVNNAGITQQQLYELRPDSRVKNSVYWQTKYHFTSAVVDFSYRYFWDDWEVKSHTFDLRYHWPLNSGYLEPHLRYYLQDAAEFYRPFITNDSQLPNYMSADYRLGKLDGLTIGLKYGLPLNNGDELSFRFELIQQSPKNPGVEAPGVLAQMELYEKINAAMLQVSYAF